MARQLTKLWRIRFDNGFELECFRDRKPTRLADSWATSQLADGSVYGVYTIAYCGTFNRKILELRAATCIVL